MRYNSPLRYPGGKAKLAPMIKDIFQKNNLLGATYVEPYSGGAAVALTLLLDGYASNIIINDVDPAVYAFWHVLVHNTNDLCRRIKQVDVSVAEWDKQREINTNHTNYTIEEVAFSTFFMNRTNRSGIIRGGIIGGRQQAGNYKIDCRFHKENLIARIEAIANYKGAISVFNKDALELIDYVEAQQFNNVFFYFDPPYYHKGQTLYKNSYTPQCHAMVAERIQRLQQPWIVTYDNVPEIKALYGQNTSHDFLINYSASKIAKGKEVLFYNNLNVPPCLNQKNQ